MRFLWTTSEKPFAKLIRRLLRNDCSHMSICFGEGDYGIVIESTLFTGVRPTWVKTFVKSNRIVHVVNLPVDSGLELEMYQSIIDKVGGKAYDWKALPFWLLKMLGEKVGIYLSKNTWADRNDIYCVEILSAIRDELECMGADLSALDNQLITPHEAYLELAKIAGFP